MCQMQAANTVLEMVKARYFKNGCVDCSFNRDGELPGCELVARDCFMWYYSRGEPRDLEEWGKVGDGRVRNFVRET